MNGLAPSWALSAQAIHVAAEPALQARPGVHLRVMPGLELGLPVAPLVLRRFNLGCAAAAGQEAHVIWTDAEGNQLPTEFDLPENGPVTAWLPAEQGNPVVWAGVELDAHDGEARVEAYVSSLHGPGLLAAISRFPWQVAATGIDRLVVSGVGRVSGVKVFRAQSVPPGRVPPSGSLALPIREGLRYQGPSNAAGLAEARVLAGAPQRLGLHEDFAAADPASCREIAAEAELRRVQFLWDQQLEEMVTALIETPAPPQRLQLPRSFSGEGLVNASAEARLPALAATMQAALDPGLGRALGLVHHEESEEAGEDGELVLYIVQGAWAIQTELNIAASLVPPPMLLLQQIAAEGGGGGFSPSLPPWIVEEGIQVISLWTVAAVVLGAEPEPPRPPAITGAEDLGWVDQPPPAARRRLALGLAGLGPGASVALARTAPDPEGLNPKLPDFDPGDQGPRRRLPILCGVPAELGPAPGASDAGQGEVHDPGAPAEASRYRVAQADWFGRWSEWGAGEAPPGVRPRVPIPVLDAGFVPPATDGEPGLLEVRCQQPRDRDLAPGSLPLRWLRLEAKLSPSGSPQLFEVRAEQGGAEPGKAPPPLRAELTVPALGRGERRRLSVRGAWIDSGEADPAGRDWSPPAAALASDPRPPLALELPKQLRYASRPDALGRSRVRLHWPAQAAPTEYRIYHSDETTLLRNLKERHPDRYQGLVNELRARPGAPDRADAFVQRSQFFERECFELLTAPPLRRPDPDPAHAEELSYEHELSGSLAVLAFYRVVPVSDLGAEAQFTACTLQSRGVPNAPAPPVPSLGAEIDPDDGTRVRLTVDVPAGATGPVRARLRRSRVGGEDPLAMPVVESVESAQWPLRLTDAGKGPWGGTARLLPWSTYTWRAEVQGADELGSQVAGAWSPPSAPVSLRIVPPPPGAVGDGSVSAAAAAGAELRFAAPHPLDGGSAGAYAVELYRRLPAGAVAAGVESGAVGSFDPAALRQPDGSYFAADVAPVPAGTAYLVELVDPLGRRGPRVEIGKTN